MNMLDANETAIVDMFGSQPQTTWNLAMASAAGISTAVSAFTVYSNRAVLLCEPSFLSILLAVASGAVLFTVFGQLIPEARSLVHLGLSQWETNPTHCVSLAVYATMAAGVLSVWLVDVLCQIFCMQPQQNDSFDQSSNTSNMSTMMEASSSRRSSDPVGTNLVQIRDDSARKDAMYCSGFAKLVSFACQNLPEGFCIYLATVQRRPLGVVMSVTIVLFNFAETIALAGFLCMTTRLRLRAIVSCAASGSSAIAGALLAWWSVQTIIMGSLAVGLVYAVTGGILVGMVLTQVLPVCYNYRGDDGYLVTMGVFGGVIFSGAVRMLLAFVG